MREMKDSGIEWIGEIPKTWQLVQLKRFANVNNGREIKREVSEDYPGAIGVYGSGGIFKYTDEMQYYGKAVMFGRKGTLGKPLYVDDSFWAVDTMYFLTYKSGLDERFSYYQLIIFDWEPYITHTAIPSIVASQIVSCHFPIPNKCEQNRIASYLDVKCVELDNILTKTRDSIEEYKKLKQSIITDAVTKGIRDNRPMKDSGIEWIGEIPAEWEVLRLKSVARDFSKGSGITKEDTVINGDTPCVRYGEIYSKYNQSFTECVTKTNKEIISPQKYFSYGDILFTCTGELVEEIGKSIVYLGDGKCLAGGDIIILKHEQNPAFLNYVLNSAYAQAQKSCGKTKLKVVHISATDIGNIMIALSSISEQQEIADYLDKKCTEIDNIIAKKEKYLAEIENYKKSLIYEYVTGKKEVPETWA